MLINKKLLVLIFILLPFIPVVPCGFHPPSFRGYTLINPEILGVQLGKPFLFSEAYYSYFYYYPFDGESSAKDENIEEWKLYFCNNPIYEDIEEIIYSANIADLKLIKKKEINRNFKLSKRYENNTLVTHLSNYGHSDFLDYLIFAKKCEPIIANPWGNRWKNGNTNHAKISIELQELGREQYDCATDEFIKLRYAFQIVRLAHYFSGDPVVEFENYVEPLQHISSIMQYWSLAHKAGALVKSENFDEKIEGNYLFSKVMSNSGFRSGAHWRSMNISTEKEWKAVLKRCENDKERATLHYLRALEIYSKAVEEMESIYDLYPDAKVLEVLLIREMQKLEAALLEDKFDSFEQLPKGFKGIPKREAKQYLKRMKTFVKRVVKEDKMIRHALWLAVDGYLEFLDDNNRVAQKILKEALEKSTEKNLLNDQIEVLQFALLLNLMNTVEPWMEEILGNMLKTNKAVQNQFKAEIKVKSAPSTVWNHKFKRWFEYEEHNYLMEKVADLYYKKGNYGKAYLCLYSIYGLKYYPHIQTTKSILELFDKVDKTEFEKYLLEKETVTDRNEIMDILGTNLLAENKFYEAKNVFSQIPAFGEDIPNPFKSVVNRYSGEQFEKMSKLAITEKVIVLKNQAKGFTEKRAVANLKLGNFYYNTSSFGHAWRAKDFFISIYSDNTLIHPLDYKLTPHIYDGARGNKEYDGVSKALLYYKRAMDTKNKELKAEALFMLAKCKRREYRNKNYSKYEHPKKDAPPKDYLTTYQQIERDFQDTDYYKMVIKGCADYSAYVNQ